MMASSCTPAFRWARDIEPPELVVSRVVSRRHSVCFLSNTEERILVCYFYRGMHETPPDIGALERTGVRVDCPRNWRDVR
jgi:hypothetical protein